MVWRSCVWVASIIGVLCTFSLWGWGGLAYSAFMCTLFAAIVGTCALAAGGRPAAGRAVRLIAAGGLFLTASTGLLAVFHVVGLAVVLLLAACSPGLTAGIRLWLSSGRTPTVEPVADKGVATTAEDVALEPRRVLRLPRDIAEADDEALCVAWRRSYMLLLMARSTVEHLMVVEERTKILDELARRCPDGIAAWWTAGGRASGNPLPFLGSHTSGTDPGAV
jgi:hypothetical protein